MLNKATVTGILAALLLSCGAGTALGQNQFSLGALQPGQLLLNLSANEQRDVGSGHAQCHPAIQCSGAQPDRTAERGEYHDAQGSRPARSR